MIFLQETWQIGDVPDNFLYILSDNIIVLL